MSDLNQYIPNLGKTNGPTISGSDIGSNTITSLNVQTALVQYASVTITSAQILALNATPVQLLPSSGSAFGYVVTDIAVDVSTGTAYAAGGSVSFFYGAGTTTLLVGSVPATAFTTTIGTTVYLAPSASGTQVFTNTVVSLGMTGSTAFTTGNETATVNLWYATIPTGH